MKTRRHLWKNNQGLAAVEFAFVLPVMLSMLLGLVELSQALLVRGDVTNMASTGADLIAQESAATNADLSNVYTALTSMLYPFGTANAHITLTSIIDNGTSGVSGTVAWTCSYGGTDAHHNGDTLALPQPSSGTNQMMPSGGSLILAEISYSYQFADFLFPRRHQDASSNNFYSQAAPDRADPYVRRLPLDGRCFKSARADQPFLRHRRRSEFPNG